MWELVSSSNSSASGASDDDNSLWNYEPHDAETLETIFSRLEKPLYSNEDLFREFPELQNDTKRLELDNGKSVLKKNKKIYDDFLALAIDEPKVDDLVYEDDTYAGKANAAILSLVRNEDLKTLLPAIQQMEDKFNKRFNYPYILLNERNFTERFKESVRSLLPPERIVKFGKIDDEDWNMPDSIDNNKYHSAVEKLKEEKVSYVDMESYHNMCRFYSREFYHHPLLKDVKYTWRLEPGISFYCDIKYDIFQFMEMHDKVYGYVLNLYDGPESIRTLWNTTMQFVEKNPQYLNVNGAYEWLKENGQKPRNFEITNGYSTCHFWTNFEITNLEFLRSEAYEKYMDFLENSGGFYYERWGDAPVRSIALALFIDKSRIHWFRDIGYNHAPYTNCPKCDPQNNRCDGKCKPGLFSIWDNLNTENCHATWIKYVMSEEEKHIY